MAKNNLVLNVKFTKIGNKIKCQLPVKMFCEVQNIELPSSFTFDKTDCLFKTWLGDVDRVFKKSNTVIKKVNLNQVYDKCDKPKSK